MTTRVVKSPAHLREMILVGEEEREIAGEAHEAAKRKAIEEAHPVGVALLQELRVIGARGRDLLRGIVFRADCEDEHHGQ